MNDLELTKSATLHRSAPTAVGELPPRDLAWENELCLLLSALDPFRDRLAHSLTINRSAAALEAMLAIGEHLVAFAEARLDADAWGETLTSHQVRAKEVLASAHRLHARLNKTPWERLLRMLGKPSQGGNPHAQFLSCAGGLFEMLTAYFGLFAHCFESVEGTRRWEDAYAVFLADLRGLLDQIAPAKSDQ